MKHEGKTEQEWNDEIRAYTVDTVIRQLIIRVVQDAKYKFKGEPSYANLEMENKPVLETFEDELPEYKADELARIAALFVKLAAEKAIKDRLEVIGDNLVEAARLNNITVSNKELFKKEIIKDQATATLSLLEGKLPEIIAANSKASGIDKALRAIEGGKWIMAYMAALNSMKKPTITEVKAVLKDKNLDLIKNMLESGSLRSAKAEIEAYVPSGIITQEDKDLILEELTRIMGG